MTLTTILRTRPARGASARASLAAAGLSVGLFATGLPAHAHGKLLAATPADGSSVAAAPAELTLRFNEPVEASVTSIDLVAPDGRTTRIGNAQAGPAGAATVALPLPAGLAAGAYRVRWATMGRDGHRVHGEIGFTVK